MKKLVLLLAVAFSVSMFSCGGNDKKAEADSVATDTVAVLAEETIIVENDSCATPDSCEACNADSTAANA